MTDLCEAWQELTDDHVLDPMQEPSDVGEDIFHSRTSNWIAQEMWQFFASKGVSPDSPLMKTNRADLLEIYCCSESQLTHQARMQGLWAERHSIQDGDLNHQHGRYRLYERLLRLRPKHIWLSPKCKAWCRWNEFNRHKSQELAQKIMSERQDDQVHLMLCDALFGFQKRHDTCHAHLEQPAGSQMLFQEELENIVAESWLARCDMCTAGKLKHPITGNPIQKGTQILTSSEIMHRFLEGLKCSRSHVHDHVEGSFKSSQGRQNVSAYTELYTRAFGQKVARCIQCSIRVKERSHYEHVFAARKSPPETGSNKRRRLNVKPLDDVLNETDSFLQMALQQAPTVGKRYVTQGELLNRAQSLHPDFQVQWIELCKGAERYRGPPPNVTKEQCPWRMTMIVKRDGTGNFCEDSWEEWGKLKRKDLLRKGHPARLIVTLFASRPSPSPVENVTIPVPAPAIAMDSDGPTAKRPCLTKPPVEAPLEVPNNAERMPPEGHSGSSKLPCLSPEQSTCDPEPLPKSCHGPKFLALAPEERQQLTRMHSNLGHPDSVVLGNVLKQQGWPQHAIDGIRDMHCSSCHERQRPRLARPSHLSTPRSFNDVVSMDAVTWTSQQGREFLFYHLIDSGTNFHVAFFCPNRPTSSQLALLINKYWVSWAGPPKELITDNAGEFCSEEFCRYLQSMDTKGHAIAAEAHWQLGRCERHGAVLQTMLDKYQQDHSIGTDEEFEMALQHCCAAKNSLSRYRGYSPEILVLRKCRHTPASNLNEEPGPSDLLAEQTASRECTNPRNEGFLE